MAVLLPTGEVLATGGKHSQPGVETFEVFGPPYLFKGNQPKILSVTPDPVHHGDEFTILDTDGVPSEAELIFLH